ncbi:MAG: putative zinc-binding metallopeptidase, partial [Ferrovibrio sp.]
TMATFRNLFGDERQDYGNSLKAHYDNGPPAGWQDGYVSAYATMHPWEDFAETWAHYMHIVDTLETAGAFGLRVKPRISRGEELGVRVDFDPYHAETVEQLIEAFLPVTFAVNSLNRSMGQQDFYPFVLSPAAISKLDFIHQLCRQAREGQPRMLQGTQFQTTFGAAPILQANQPQIETVAEQDMTEQTAVLLTVASQLALDPVA